MESSARRTSVATNVYNVVKAGRTSGKQKPIIFMGDRMITTRNKLVMVMPHYWGSYAQATHAMNEWWGKTGMGTMPHALIQLFEGDTVAAKAYHEVYPEDDLTVLVDYNNDVITDALKVAREFGDTLKCVRLDTSNNMVDKYFLRNAHLLGKFDPRGVNPELIFALRKALDDEGYQHVKIMASGGFTEDKIRMFEKRNVPVDLYGVGRNLLDINIGFTGDNVILNGKQESKAGRQYQPNPRLEKVEYKK